MKINNKLILTAIGFLSVGLILGFILFGTDKDAKKTPASEDLVEGSTETEEIWTCSMHPQVRQNEPGLCPICEMDLIPLGSGSSDDPLVLKMTDEAVKLAQIETTTIGSAGSTGKSIRLSGKISEDERLSFSQVAHIPGRIEKLFVTFTGEQVNKGQKLATLYSPDLITAQRELLEAWKLKGTNPALLEAARNKLRNWKISDEDIEAVVKKEEVRETFTIYADRTGIVRERNVTVGDYVKKGEVLFQMADLSKVWVLFDAYEKDLPYISKGQRIEFTTPGIPGKTFSTMVTFIDPVIDPKTRVASVRCEISNSKGFLKPEMLVTGIYKQDDQPESGMVVPRSAVMWTGRRSVVYVKLKDANVPSFEYREVEIGESLGDNYIVLSGIEKGDEVVTNGSFTIDAAAQLNNQASMMNQGVSIKGKTVDYTPDFSNEIPQDFKSQLSEVSRAYLDLKDALVATDAEKAREDGNRLINTIEKVNMSLLTGEAHSFWMDEMKKMMEHTQIISGKKDVEEQRKQFEFLSESLINVIKAFGTTTDSLYVQHCPMAFDNDGADWLSDVREIRNPYFGSKMLKCGMVKTAIGTK